jgi:hypothetical protein
MAADYSTDHDCLPRNPQTEQLSWWVTCAYAFQAKDWGVALEHRGGQRPSALAQFDGRGLTTVLTAGNFPSLRICVALVGGRDPLLQLDNLEAARFFVLADLSGFFTQTRFTKHDNLLSNNEKTKHEQ